MKRMQDYSFSIPQKMRGRFVIIPPWQKSDFPLATYVPYEAHYLDVNSQNNEKGLPNSHGNQLRFFDDSKNCVFTRTIEEPNPRLMWRLEKVFPKTGR